MHSTVCLATLEYSTMECEVELIDGTCRVVCQHEALVSGLLSRLLRDTAAYANLKGIVVMLNPPLLCRYIVLSEIA